jgi:hypothetical protein
VYLAYVDDSGSGDKRRPLRTMTAVVITDNEFIGLEMLVGINAAIIVPDEPKEPFEEFHAYQLYNGFGPFEGVDQPQRFDAIRSLLSIIKTCHVSVFCGAVDKEKLEAKSYGSADPIDMCFRMCLGGVADWVRKRNQMALLILDDPENNKELKRKLRISFRRQRKKIWEQDAHDHHWHFHDDMYFGSSAESIGLQLADLCGYFIAKHLRNDIETEGFYSIIKDHIVYEKIGPE